MKISKKKFFEIFLICIFALIVSTFGILFFYQNAYAGKIYKNIKIAGVDVSGKTKKQAEALVKKKFDSILSQNITMKAGEKSIFVPLFDTGLSFDINKSITEAYAVGRSHKFFPQLYASAKTSYAKNYISVAVLIDNTKLNLFISNKIPELNIQPQDASIQIVDGSVSIAPDVVGQQVDTSTIASDLSKLVSSGKKDLVIQLNAIATTSKITSQILEQQKTIATKMIDTKITLKYNDKSYIPRAEEISKWIVFYTEDNTANTGIDDNAVKAYLTTIAKNFEIIKKDKKINAIDNSVLEEGQQGIYLDKNKALEEIKNALNKHLSIEIQLATYTEDPREIKVYPAEGIIPDKFSGKYLDIDLTQQRLCRIENNAIIDCFIISSGKASMPTPTGTRYIDSKEVKRWSNTYGLWMPYWQSIGGGYGIHELPIWPSGYQEGESHLGTPVSHGCVRLGKGSAETVFNWTEVGTPVYIHK